MPKFEENWMLFHLMYPKTFSIVSAGNFSGFSSRQIYLTYTLVLIMLADWLKDHTTAIYWFNLNNKQT